MGIFRWDYPENSVSGYWGETTSTIDWCEENYVVSPYVAEWSNTLTNSVFILSAVYTTYSAYKNKLEKRFLLIGFGYGLVGVGSLLFHMTLKYRFQLLDELPMIYAMCVPTWSLVCEAKEALLNGDNQRKVPLFEQLFIGIIIAVAVTTASVLYVIHKNVDIHQILFGVQIVVVAAAAGILTYRYVHDPLAKRNLRTSMALGAGFFLSGYISWLLDIHLCSFWVYIRRSILALPLGVLLELHGWWHILTGMGIYFYIVSLEHLRVITLNVSSDYQFIWRWKVFPELVRKGRNLSTRYSLELFGPYVQDESVEAHKKKN
ncbi:hypothetical protein SUVZ_04G3940 [Saccharomyces uvarum]|uniref:Uncharacterized protein n=1 Tax=Saccharomyces uvarum TaxID=230603 RepID=A0ABN8WUQ8_SACUV|nr:hypothetical protein SUVZ_04G3940 [Saccharomyces uvarum]